MTITPQTRLTVVKALASGRDQQFVRDATGLSFEQVRQIAQAHGYPDKEKLAWAADRLKSKLDEQARALPPAATVTFKGPGEAAPRLTAVTTDGGQIEQLLDRASKSKRANTRAMADRIRKDLDRIQERLDSEAAEAACRRQAEREQAKAKAEIARLEKELAEAKARLRGKPTPAAAPTVTPQVPSTPGKKTVRRPDYDFRAVRAWAKDNGVDCPPRGMWLPDHVVEQWRAATQEGAA